MPLVSELFINFAAAWAIVSNTWWLWLPAALFFAGKWVWAYYLKVRYFSSLKWVLLEIKIPRNIAKSPQAMEQVFTGLQAMFWSFDPLEKWWEGLQHDFIVWEMASTAGETRFYVKVPVFFRDVVEAQIYAQYPECEIAEAEDYTLDLPGEMPNNDWDLFGIEFRLDKPDAYPIRTYVEFSTIETMKEEERKVDPFASMAELFGNIGPGEHMGYHLLIRPVQDDRWKEEGQKLVDKLIGRKRAAAKSPLDEFFEPFLPAFQGWFEPLRPLFGLEALGAAAPPERKKENGEGTSLMQHISPGTREIVAAIERNILKRGFECIVRFCYVARRDVFNLSHLAAFVSALKQYNTHTLNGFELNTKAMATKSYWWWSKSWKRRRTDYKKWLFWNYYRSRKPFTDTQYLRSKPVVLNTEELASIYHYPGLTAKAPMLPRIEARRAEPPAALPVG